MYKALTLVPSTKKDNRKAERMEEERNPDCLLFSSPNFNTYTFLSVLIHSLPICQHKETTSQLFVDTKDFVRRKICFLLLLIIIIV